jgi:hypothetical protein
MAEIYLHNPKHEVVYEDLIKLMRGHADVLTPLELLAIASNMVGKILALQDRTETAYDEAMNTIKVNVEYGYQVVNDVVRVGPKGLAS